MTETKVKLIQELGRIIRTLSIDELKIIIDVARDIQNYGKSQPATTQKLGNFGR